MRNLLKLFLGLFILWILIFLLGGFLDAYLLILETDITEQSDNYRFFRKHSYSLLLFIGVFVIYKIQKLSSPLKPLLFKFFLISTLIAFLLKTFIVLLTYFISPTEGFFVINYNYEFSLLPLYLIAIFVGALVEELIFRHFVITHLESVLNKKHTLIIFISAGFFSILHFSYGDIYIIFSIFIFGILYGALFIQYKSIWIPLGVHLAHNLFYHILGGDIVNLTTSDNFIYGEFRPLYSLIEAVIIYWLIIKLCPITKIRTVRSTKYKHPIDYTE